MQQFFYNGICRGKSYKIVNINGDSILKNVLNIKKNLRNHEFIFVFDLLKL